jgi:hypothetical protein
MEIKIVNCATGEEIVRDATKDEIVNLEKSQLDAQKQRVEIEAKREAKAAAQAKLAALGLTVEDLTALGL